jgi:hypothetical protein
MKKTSALAAPYVQVKPARHHVALPLSIMGAFYWLSSIPGTPSPEDPATYALYYWVSPTLQNFLHVPAYAFLAAAWGWALRAWVPAENGRAMAACGLALAYGALDEWHQSFVPGRYASLTDIVLNAAGAVLGIWLIGWAGRAMAGRPKY